MSFMRPLGKTGLSVSALGLGTVKFGRNTGVKYPTAFELPTDAAIRKLLQEARELGINLLDTAPAYGKSEERIGQLLSNRQDWVLATKVGEEYDGSDSHFDFSASGVRFSIERSLQRLRTDYLDLVLIHSDGNDEKILQHSDCVESLRRLQQQGLVRAIGMSCKSDAGGVVAATLLDVVMVTYNLQQQDRATVEQAQKLGKGVLVKKGLMSGHVQNPAGHPQARVQQSMQLILGTAGIHCVIVGTLNSEHLASNSNSAKAALAAIAEC